MPLTITKPAVGSNGWGPTMNTNLDNIKNAVDTNESNYGNHTTGEGYKHQANQIEMPDASSVEDAINALASSISDLGDAVGVSYDDGTRVVTVASALNDIYEKLAGIQAILTTNTSNVVVSARAREIPGYIEINCSISPGDIAPRFWRAIVSKKEGTGLLSTVVEVLAQDFTASRTTIPFDILSGVDVGDVLYVKCYAYFSESEFVEANEQSLTYQGYETPVINRIRSLEEGLTLANIVDAVKNSEEILTLLSNSLQNSTTLARKVAEETSTT